MRPITFRRVTRLSSAAAGAALAIGACALPDEPEPTTGQAVFWTDDARVVPFTVVVSGKGSGTVTTRFTAAPSCGGAGAFTITLPGGVAHPYSAVSTTGYSGQGTVEVPNGGCLAVQLVPQTGARR
jgi:hypothetical protein